MDSDWTWASSIFGLLKPNETKNISVGPQVKKINEPTEWRFRLSLEISVQSSSMVNEVGKCLPCFQGKKVYHKDFIIRKQWIQRQKIDIFICAGIPISRNLSYRRIVETVRRLKQKQLVRTLIYSTDE